MREDTQNTFGAMLATIGLLGGTGVATGALVASQTADVSACENDICYPGWFSSSCIDNPNGHGTSCDVTGSGTCATNGCSS